MIANADQFCIVGEVIDVVVDFSFDLNPFSIHQEFSEVQVLQVDDFALQSCFFVIVRPAKKLLFFFIFVILI